MELAAGKAQPTRHSPDTGRALDSRDSPTDVVARALQMLAQESRVWNAASRGRLEQALKLTRLDTGRAT
jgi:hypothetical protein